MRNQYRIQHTQSFVLKTMNIKNINDMLLLHDYSMLLHVKYIMYVSHCEKSNCEPSNHILLDPLCHFKVDFIQILYRSSHLI